MNEDCSAQYRDKFTCPNCGSNDTRRIKRASSEQAIWECHICNWAYVVRDSVQSNIAENGDSATGEK
jgi:ribosomal protein L37AE/L43A